MSIYQIIYLLLLVLAFLLSIYYYPSFSHNPSFKIFPYLLGFSIITEAVVNILGYIYRFKAVEYIFVYHIYIPIEYTFLAYFFYLNAISKFKKYIILSIPAYTALSIFLSFIVYSGRSHPGLNLNIEGVLLVFLSLSALLTIKPVHPIIPITRLPLFWVCLGIIIYHSGTFVFNGVYNKLLESNSVIIKNLNLFSVKLPNYLLYVCFSISFICSNQMKKYI